MRSPSCLQTGHAVYGTVRLQWVSQLVSVIKNKLGPAGSTTQHGCCLTLVYGAEDREKLVV